MAENYAKITMYVNRDVEDVIKAKQFDAASRFLDITLVQDNGLPYNLTGHRIQFNAMKRDKMFIMNNAEIINAAGGVFRVELTDQTLAVGNSIVVADVTIFTDDHKKILTTRTFEILVQSTIRNDDAIESSNEYDSVVRLFQDVWDMRTFIRRIGDFSDNITGSEEQAGKSILGGLNRIWNLLKQTKSVADSTKSVADAINNKIGTSSDGGSVFSWLGSIKSVVDGIKNSLGNGFSGEGLFGWITKIYDKVSEIALYVGTERQYLVPSNNIKYGGTMLNVNSLPIGYQIKFNFNFNGIIAFRFRAGTGGTPGAAFKFDNGAQTYDIDSDANPDRITNIRVYKNVDLIITNAKVISYPTYSVAYDIVRTDKEINIIGGHY